MDQGIVNPLGAHHLLFLFLAVRLMVRATMDCGRSDGWLASSRRERHLLGTILFEGAFL